MLSFPANVHVFLCREPVDLRKSFDGLMVLVASEIRSTATCFCFSIGDGTGSRCCIGIVAAWRCGTSGWRKARSKSRRPLIRVEASSWNATQLALLLTGIDLKSAQRRKRYTRAA
jgi:hypothetical protein